MSFWEKIHSFFLSELWGKISFIIFIVYVVLDITTTIIDKYLERKAVKQFEAKMVKYGLPADLEAPDHVSWHIATLIYLCEKYELDSLYEAQDKFDELFTAHWRSTKLSDEDMKRLQHPESKLSRIRTCSTADREIELLKRSRILSYEAHGGGMFHDPQRPDDYIEDKPDET